MNRAGHPVHSSPRPLTDRQRGILEQIAACIAQNGYAPTTRELALLVGIKGLNALNDHLWALRRKGYVEWQDSKARTLRILKPLSADGKVVANG
jgi:repressor LexA